MSTTLCVHDANRLVRPLRGREVVLVVLGKRGRTEIVRGLLVRVLHAPDSGFSLLLRRTGPVGSRGSTGTTRVPIMGIRGPLPAGLEFLRLPTEEWPLLRDTTRCGGCGHEETGRFCRSCGTGLHRRSHMGIPFRTEQERLRGLGGAEHSCGAMTPKGARFCPKCSLPVANGEGNPS